MEKYLNRELSFRFGAKTGRKEIYNSLGSSVFILSEICGEESALHSPSADLRQRTGKLVQATCIHAIMSNAMMNDNVIWQIRT